MQSMSYLDILEIMFVLAYVGRRSFEMMDDCLIDVVMILWLSRFVIKREKEICMTLKIK